MTIFLASCGPQGSEQTSKNLSGSPYSDTDSNYKYNSMYNKLLIELLLHKNRYNEALDVFTSNVNYFNTEEDFFSMISRARDLKKFDDIKIITKRWLDLDSSSISARKISFANSIELADFNSANIHFEYLYKVHKKKNNKSYINLEDILSRNIVVKNIVTYFEQNLKNYKSEYLLISYLNVLQKNDLDQVAVSYLKNMKISDNRALIRKYAKAQSKLSNTDEAVLTLEKYINSLSYTDREVSFELLGLYLVKNDEQKYISLIENLLSIDPTDDDFMFRVALLCFDKQKFNLSEKYFNILLSKSYAPDNINFFLGQIDYNNQRYNEALLHYERIQQGTFVTTKHLNVARALSKQYDITRAITYLNQEINVKTKNDKLNLLSLKLSLYQEPYNVDKVIEVSSEILGSFPNNDRALYSRALAYEKKGELENMSSDFEKMISSNPYNSIALNAYGYSLLLQNKKLSYAEDLIRRAINIDPGNAAILDSLAWALYLDGSYKDAYKYASLAYIKDQDPEIVTHYYKILLKNGFANKARDILEKSLISNPKNTELLKLMDDSTDEAAQL